MNKEIKNNDNVVSIINSLREDSINNFNKVVELIEVQLFINELIKRIAKVIVDSRGEQK